MLALRDPVQPADGDGSSGDRSGRRGRPDGAPRRPRASCSARWCVNATCAAAGSRQDRLRVSRCRLQCDVSGL
eukprot:1671001-Prymnesium_polylepis.1